MYCFGDPAKMSDESVRLALRVHDEVLNPPFLVNDFRRTPSDPMTVQRK